MLVRWLHARRRVRDSVVCVVGMLPRTRWSAQEPRVPSSFRESVTHAFRQEGTGEWNGSRRDSTVFGGKGWGFVRCTGLEEETFDTKNSLFEDVT